VDGVDAHAQTLELLARERGPVRGALHRAHPGLYSDRLKVVGDRFAGREIGRPRVEVAGVEAVRVARLGEQLLCLGRIMRIWLELERELEAAWHDIAGRRRSAERLRFTDRAGVDRMGGGKPHPAIGPWRLRVPLIEEVEVERAD